MNALHHFQVFANEPVHRLLLYHIGLGRCRCCRLDDDRKAHFQQILQSIYNACKPNCYTDSFHINTNTNTNTKTE